ncbi:hypothetical protein RN001_005047, partial [Aquatica leii]
IVVVCATTANNIDYRNSKPGIKSEYREARNLPVLSTFFLLPFVGGSGSASGRGFESKAWITVANNFIAINRIARSPDQLKIKYENLKMKAQRFAADHRFCQGTGGGPPNINIKDPVLDAVLRIINFKTVVGLINSFDINAIRNNVQNKENVLPVTVYEAKLVTVRRRFGLRDFPVSTSFRTSVGIKMHRWHVYLYVRFTADPLIFNVEALVVARG